LLSKYEQSRLERMRSNERALRAMGLVKMSEQLIGREKKKKSASRAKRRSESKEKKKKAATRRSSRIRSMPAPTYVPPSPLEEIESKKDSLRDEIRAGYRDKHDKKWIGERFGHIPSVEVGTVFGEGDYQRQGRTEMKTCGFFRPWVTPEWIERNGACYAVIINNDNGLSQDKGDIIRYAGSGGRMRGQNRNAKQSFDQSWKNATNAALRKNKETNQPVRVIRGPKLRSKFGTSKSGGGYRYDGLYKVTSAELENVSGRFLTAMFTLEKCAPSAYTLDTKRKRTASGRSGVEKRIRTGTGKTLEGDVAWKWGNKTCYGTLLPKRETATHCYARTKNDNIKTLRKGKSYWWCC